MTPDTSQVAPSNICVCLPAVRPCPFFIHAIASSWSAWSGSIKDIIYSTAGVFHPDSRDLSDFTPI